MQCNYVRYVKYNTIAWIEFNIITDELKQFWTNCSPIFWLYYIYKLWWFIVPKMDIKKLLRIFHDYFLWWMITARFIVLPQSSNSFLFNPGRTTFPHTHRASSIRHQRILARISRRITRTSRFSRFKTRIAWHIMRWRYCACKDGTVVPLNAHFQTSQFSFTAS